MGKYIIEVDESEIVECWNEQAAKELGYQEYALKKCPEIKVKIYNPSGDLISREALKEQINATDFDFGDYYDNTDEIRKRVCEAIDNAQPVEPERITGEWIPLYPRTVGEWEYKCSNCGHRGFMHQHNFCPDCGADMRKGAAE